MNDRMKNFKKGIFLLNTNFGELAQLMVKKLEHFHSADAKYYDLLTTDGKRVEVKFSRAKKKSEPLNEQNAVNLCIEATTDANILMENDATKYIYDCNIQQIKHDEFDYLYYGIFFNDKIMIFRAQSDDVVNMPGYSIQHKGGTEYQFHIKNTVYDFHKKNFLYKELSYEELFNLFEKN